MQIRTVVSVLVWFLCLPSVAGYLLLCLGSLNALSYVGQTDLGSIPKLVFMFVAFPCGCFAWANLARMNIYWLRNSRLLWPWPVGGTIAALIALVPLSETVLPIVLASPGIVFAAYLVAWHLYLSKHRATGNA